MKETIQEKLIGAYIQAFTDARGHAPAVAYYATGFYYIAGNPGVAPHPIRRGKLEEMTERLRIAGSPEGKMRAALSKAGFRPIGNNWQLTDSHAVATATDRKGLLAPMPGNWALVVRVTGSDDDADTDIQCDDEGADLVAAIHQCAHRVAEISKAARMKAAAEKLAAEYDSECNPNRAGELRRAFSMLPEPSAARLYDIITTTGN